jgi:hypothetical protein
MLRIDCVLVVAQLFLQTQPPTSVLGNALTHSRMSEHASANQTVSVWEKSLITAPTLVFPYAQLILICMKKTLSVLRNVQTVYLLTPPQT